MKLNYVKFIQVKFNYVHLGVFRNLLVLCLLNTAFYPPKRGSLAPPAHHHMLWEQRQSSAATDISGPLDCVTDWCLLVCSFLRLQRKGMEAASCEF